MQGSDCPKVGSIKEISLCIKRGTQHQVPIGSVESPLAPRNFLGAEFEYDDNKSFESSSFYLGNEFYFVQNPTHGSKYRPILIYVDMGFELPEMILIL